MPQSRRTGRYQRSLQMAALVATAGIVEGGPVTSTRCSPDAMTPGLPLVPGDADRVPVRIRGPGVTAGEFAPMLAAIDGHGRRPTCCGVHVVRTRGR